MTGLLLDTNVISMFAPTKVVQNKAFADWIEERETHEGVFLSEAFSSFRRALDVA